MLLLLLRSTFVAAFPWHSTGLQPQIKVTCEKAMPAWLPLAMPDDEKYGACNDLHVPPANRLEALRGKRAVTADTTLCLARYLGASDEFWPGRQADYDLEEARNKLCQRLNNGAFLLHGAQGGSPLASRSSDTGAALRIGSTPPQVSAEDDFWSPPRTAKRISKLGLRGGHLKGRPTTHAC